MCWCCMSRGHTSVQCSKRCSACRGRHNVALCADTERQKRERLQVSWRKSFLASTVATALQSSLPRCLPQKTQLPSLAVGFCPEVCAVASPHAWDTKCYPCVAPWLLPASKVEASEHRTSSFRERHYARGSQSCDSSACSAGGSLSSHRLVGV